MGRAWWGRGYTTEACDALLAHGFGPLGFDEIVAHAMTHNPASIRVLEKLGMRSLGIIPDACEKDGCRYDAEGFALTRREWEARER